MLFFFPPEPLSLSGDEGFWGGFMDGLQSQSTPMSDIFSLLTFIPSLAVGARRLHDIGRTGWWQISPLIAIIGLTVAAIVSIGTDSGSNLAVVVMIVSGLIMLGLFILILVWYCTDSHRHENKYGPSPKYGSQASAFD